jgi:hydrogenase maturation protein HypF
MESARVKILVKGIVQGVGFRPFVYCLAKSLNLKGFVMNSSEGVVIEIEGEDSSIFIDKLRKEASPLSQITGVDITQMPYYGYQDFQIVKSKDEGSFTLISPDVSICEDCLEELLNKNDRRYLYPFINCTNCGPRYTITRSIPYDRPNTTMSPFKMCTECEKEYHNPEDRRFHAQPNACPVCGPSVELIVKNENNPPPPFTKRETGKLLEEKLKVDDKENPIKETIRLLKQGAIVAVKGLGGFHIACDASNEEAVKKLRLKKRKSNKPFALMAPDIETIKIFCTVSKDEEDLLISNKRPIVLLKKRGIVHPHPNPPPSRGRELIRFADKYSPFTGGRGLGGGGAELLQKRQDYLPDAVAPNNQYLGFMLPYTPLHYLLFYYPDTPHTPLCKRDNPPKSPFIKGGLKGDFKKREGGFLVDKSSFVTNFDALVMTSGNISEEPIVIGNEEAISKLSEIADAFLIHNRDIFMRVDDSVVRVISQKSIVNSEGLKLSTLFIRRSRGYVPDPILLHEDGPDVLGCGSDIKNTFTLTKGSFAIPGQHIGDMENYGTLKFFEESLKNMKDVYRVKPEALAYDLHPGYLSTQWALKQEGIKKFGIQHHYAHIASVMAEKGIKGKVIGVSFDGTGYGLDGNLWGGEILIADIMGFKRAGQFKYIPLPGGETSVKEPWRIAVSYIRDIAGDDALSYLKSIGFIDKYGDSKIKDILKIIDKKPFSPISSGAGRLFDAVSAILGVCDKNTFEGEAAIALESLTIPDLVDDYPVDIKFREIIEIDFSHTILRIMEDMLKGEGKGIISSKFHNTLVSVIFRVVNKLSSLYSIKDIVLCGGVFQNMYLMERTIPRLKSMGTEVHIPKKVPCNDAGISLGQAYIIRERIKGGIEN